MQKRNYINYAERAVITPASFDESKRSVEGILTTEQPVLVFDYYRWDFVNEILLVDGCENMNAKVPLLDAHNRTKSDNVIGSTMDMKKGTEDGVNVIYCKNIFSETEDKIFRKVKEGHLDSSSVGYRVFEEDSNVIEPGQSMNINGKEYKNDGEYDLVIRKRWKVMENSVVPIGADDRAKFRAFDSPENRVKKNNSDEDTNKKISEPSRSFDFYTSLINFLKIS